MKNKRGRIVSKKRHALGQKAIKHLEKSGHKGVLPKNRKMKGGEMEKAMGKAQDPIGMGRQYFLSLGGSPDVWDRKTPQEKKQYLKDNGLIGGEITPLGRVDPMMRGKQYFLSLGGSPDVWERKTPQEKKQYLKDNALI
jgi:hypothetical protein